MAGSKPKFQPEQVAQALIEMKGGVYHAAERLGCSAQMIYDYRDRYPIVADALKAERGKFIDVAELALYNAVMRGEGWAVSLTLKTIGRDRGYVERSEVDMTVSGQGLAGLLDYDRSKQKDEKD